MRSHQPSIPDPVAAVLTPRGRGAVATVRFEGDCRLIDDSEPTVFRAANGKPLSEQPIDRIVFGRWGIEVEEAVVVCRTDPQTLEIHCHGGEAAWKRVLDDLESIGCTVTSWQQMTGRTAGLFETEFLEALARATTLRTAEFLLQQQSGLLRSALEELQAAEWTCCGPVLPPSCGPVSRPDHVADRRSPEGDEIRSALQTGDLRSLPVTGSGDLATTDDGLAWIAERLDELLRWSEFGLHLSRPWGVVIVGRPNVGKSSLINALVGYSRSIVYADPGTTRDVVTAETAFDGWPFRLADTAGIRDDAEELESAGIRLAEDQIAEADLRVLLLDTSRPPHADDFRLLERWSDAIRIAHKCDLDNVWPEDQLPADALRVSSLTGEGVETVAARLVARLIPTVPKPETPFPITERQVGLLRQARQALAFHNEADFRAALSKCLK